MKPELKRPASGFDDQPFHLPRGPNTYLTLCRFVLSKSLAVKVELSLSTIAIKRLFTTAQKPMQTPLSMFASRPTSSQKELCTPVVTATPMISPVCGVCIAKLDQTLRLEKMEVGCVVILSNTKILAC
jgi:hypothetical protein